MSQTPFSYRTSHRFADVCEAFEQNFDDGLELGARFVAYQHGEKIIDISGGWSDRKKENPWSEETLSAIYSTGKSVCTLLIAREVEAGRLDYDRPVSQIWPEFAAAGKQDITLAQAMSHQAGLSGFDSEMDPSEWLEWDSIVHRIEQMEPQWAPGTASGYSPQVFGFVVGEIIRRATGQSIGAKLRELHSADGIDIHCGLTGEDAAKGAHMQKPPKAPDLGDISPIKEAAFLKPWSSPARVSREDWMAAEIPASNMHATADGLACLLQSLASENAPHALSPEVREQVFNVRISGDDLVLPFHLTWAAGLMKNTNGHFGPNPDAFGHAGFGGSCVLVDPTLGLTAAYAMNKMSEHLVGDPRALRLINAVYGAIGD